MPEKAVANQTDTRQDMAFVAATIAMAFLLPIIGPTIMAISPLTPPKAKRLATIIVTIEMVALVATCALGLAITYMPQLFDTV